MFIIEKERTAKIIEAVGSDKVNANSMTSSERILSKIQSKERKWKVLEDDSEDEEGNIKVVDALDE